MYVGIYFEVGLFCQFFSFLFVMFEVYLKVMLYRLFSLFYYKSSISSVHIELLLL